MVLNTAALVLAGGQSRRMGRDKALLPWPIGSQSISATASTTLLQRVCGVAQACSSVTYVLTPWPERYGHLLPDSIVLLTESSRGHGPLAALAQGWSMILQDAQVHDRPDPDWVMVLACDMPSLDAATLQKWQQNLGGIDAGVQGRTIACLPRHDDRWEPLCGFYHRRCIPSLENALANNIRSFQRWLAPEHDRVIPISVENSHILQNCNTPGQWQQFLDASDETNPYTA